MGVISIEKIKVYAYHGHLPEEKKLGAHFLVSVWVTADTFEVEETDQLEHTVDYVHIIDIVKEQMAIRSDMIEHLTSRIADTILTLKKVRKVKVEVEKIDPPIDAIFDKISVSIERKN